MSEPFHWKSQQWRDHVAKTLEEKKMADQVYGFTPPGPNPGQEYVPFLQAFRLANGDFEIRVRNASGVTNSIAVDVEEASALAKALSAP